MWRHGMAFIHYAIRECCEMNIISYYCPQGIHSTEHSNYDNGLRHFYRDEKIHQLL